MKEIICKDRYGNKYKVTPEKLSFRVGVCAIISQGNKVLVFKDPSTKQFELPGGGVEPGEQVEEALARECREELGISIVIKSLFTYKESFFYIKSKKQAFQTMRLFFLAEQKDVLADRHEFNGAYLDLADLTTQNTNEVSYAVLTEYSNSLDHPLKLEPHLPIDQHMLKL